MSQIELDHVLKRFGSFTAVDRLSVTIPEGSVFGLLGPNGAGKTTTIRMIMRIYSPDAGEIRFDGKPLKSAHKERIGYLPEERGLYKKMKVGEHLEYLGRLKGLTIADARDRTGRYLDRLELGEWRERKVEELSKGMQQKVQFAAALINEPSLVILDEPFSGLDPINVQLLIDWIGEMKREGRTIIFSAHQLDAVEKLCESIALIHHGKLLIEGNLGEIKARYHDNLYRLEFEGNNGFTPAGRGIVAARRKNGAWIIQLEPDDDGRGMLRKAITEGPVKKFERIEPTLQELFVRLVTESGIDPPEQT